jgi:hypothetical protein
LFFLMFEACFVFSFHISFMVFGIRMAAPRIIFGVTSCKLTRRLRSVHPASTFVLLFISSLLKIIFMDFL